MKNETKSSLRRVSASLALFLSALLSLPSTSSSQGYAGDLFVDQAIGADVPGNGTPSSPFRTITFALSQASPGAQKIAIVINPGVYDSSWGEIFPLVMKKNVSLQGTSALNTIIHGTDQTPLLISFNANTTGKFNSCFIDGLTVMRAEIGIQITGSFSANPTISNCFIDDFGKTGIDLLGTEAVGHRPKIIHCSFAFSRRDITNRTAAYNFSGPFNTVSPSAPGILNILATRMFSPAANEACLMGIDLPDMQGVDSASFGFTEGSSAFDSSIPGIGDSPFPLVPAFTPNTLPIFVYLGPAIGLNVSVFPELRLNPSTASFPNPAIGAAFQPAPGTITWDNGTTGNYEYVPSMEATLADWDCEGYGNPRFEDDPDIGADEVGSLILANPSPVTAELTRFQDGTSASWWVGPNLASTGPLDRQLITSVLRNMPAQTYTGRFFPPGNRAFGTAEPHAQSPFAGDCYLDPTIIVNQPYVISANQPGVLGLNFGLQPGTLLILDGQLSIPGTSPRLLTNLQTITVTP